MANPIETFSDVLHEIIDTVLSGEAAAKAHAVIDNSSGQRTPAPEPDPAAEAAPADAPADTATADEDVPATGGTDVPGA